MEPGAVVSNLRGGYIERYSVDLLTKVFAMRVSVLENATLSMYDVTFQNVSQFSFKDTAASEWERLELTDIWVDAAPAASKSEEWEVTLNFWDLAEVELRCARITVDGEVVH